MASMQPHPLAECWPALSEEDMAELIEDVIKNGVLEPIMIHEGMILDGRHRYAAASAAGITCPTVIYEGTDPAGFVIAKNAHRRHISKLQIAKCVALCRDWQPHGVRANTQAQSYQDGNSGDQAHTNTELASEAGVSKNTMSRAKRRIREERGEASPPGGRPPGRRPSARRERGRQPARGRTGGPRPLSAR